MSGSTPTSSGASTVLSTKGDIVGFDTARKRIGIGSNDQVLTADSTNANGLAWKAVSGAELGYLTTPTTVNPSSQTGTIGVIIDNTALTVGSTDIKVDGVATNVGATTVSSRIFNPSTSLQIIAKGVPYDMNNGTFNYEYSDSTYARAGVFKPDGTVFYIKESNKIYEFRLTTAWDLSTASRTSTYLDIGIMGSGGGVTLSIDGTKLTVAPLEGGSLRTYTLSTGWDITTSTGYVSQSNPLGGMNRGMRWINSGNKLLVNRDYSYETWSASTAYDITTLTDDNNDFTDSSTGSKRGGIDMSADGKTIIVANYGSPNKVYKYELSTAWDISTSSYSGQSLDFSSKSTAVTFCAFGELANKLVVGELYQKAYEYDIPDSFTGESNYKVI